MNLQEMEARVEELRRINRQLHQELMAIGQRLDSAQVMINQLFSDKLRLEAMVATLQGGEE